MEDYYRSAKIFLSNKEVELSGGTINEIKSHMAEMSTLREELARGLPRAKRLAGVFQVPVIAFSPTTKAQCHAFSTIINNDATGFIEDSQKLDLLNETIGACLEVEKAQLLKIINPVYWFSSTITKIIRLPFWLLETAGFKSEPFEKSLAGSVIRLVELVLLIGILLYLGFNETELKDVIKGLVNV